MSSFISIFSWNSQSLMLIEATKERQELRLDLLRYDTHFVTVDIKFKGI